MQPTRIKENPVQCLINFRCPPDVLLAGSSQSNPIKGYLTGPLSTGIDSLRRSPIPLAKALTTALSNSLSHWSKSSRIVTVRLLLIRLSNIDSHHPCLALRREASRFYYIFIAAQEHSLGALLAQQIDGGKEQALYYLSRRLIRAESRYPAVEKICLALVFAAKKLRHYMLAHKIHLISRANPLKYLISQPTMSGRVGKWSLMLMEFYITFVPQKAVKGQRQGT